MLLPKKQGMPLEVAKEMYDYLFTKMMEDELTILAIYQGNEGNEVVLRYFNGHLVLTGDLKHCSCCLYQMLAWTMPNHHSNSAQPGQPHNQYHLGRTNGPSSKNGVCKKWAGQTCIHTYIPIKD
jgi:hypothetical protein